MKRILKTAIKKYGHIVAACAFAFVTLSANSSCWIPYYEPDEPVGLDKFKKLSKAKRI